MFPLFLVQAQPRKKKALFIIVDGIPADVLEKQPTPHIDKIAAIGGYTRAYVGGEKGGYSETPTISAAGYNSLLTGTWVNKHNVWDNKITAPNYQYKTIFRYFKTQYPDKKTAIFSTWLDNRTKLIGEDKLETQQIALDYHFDGLELDTLAFPHDPESNYIHSIDEKVVQETDNYIRTQGPDLSWVYLEYPDDMGHRYGDGPRMNQAITIADNQIGRIWQAIAYRQKNFQEDWILIITTDHGRDSQGKHHGKQSDRERTTWIVTNAKQTNASFKRQPGVVDIMPTISRFLNITIPREDLVELDGIPFIGNVSINQPAAAYQNGTIQVAWKALEKTGKVKIWLATTNNYQTGGADNYKLVKEVALSDEKAILNVSQMPAEFYKIVIEAPHNTVNRWIKTKSEIFR